MNEASRVPATRGWIAVATVASVLVLAAVGGASLMRDEDNGWDHGRGMVPGLWMYNRAFYAGEFGYACAIGMILFVFILVLTFVNNRYVRIEK